MRRIAIVGCSGGGKSTLARRLGEVLGLPVVHLDALFWKPGWVESDREAFRASAAQAHASETWISDGGYSSISDLRLGAADTIIWVDQPTWLCLLRALWRPIAYRRGTRPDMAPGCDERFDPAFLRYIITWNRLARPRLAASIERHGAGARLVRLRSDREVARFVAAAAALAGS